jgi:hypothetical protein
LFVVWHVTRCKRILRVKLVLPQLVTILLAEREKLTWFIVTREGKRESVRVIPS